MQNLYKYSFEKAAENFNLAGGCYKNQCPSNQGETAFFWTSTATDDKTAANALLLINQNSSKLAYAASDLKGLGDLVRCVTESGTPYDIYYDLGGGIWDTNTNPIWKTGTTKDNFVKLYDTVPTRSDDYGYVFKGWCDERPVTNTTEGGTDTCLGTTYDAGAQVPISRSDETQYISLYAIWYKNFGCFIAGTLVDTPSGPKPIESIGYGDKVYSYDFEHEKIVEDIVDGYYDVERSDVVKMTFDNGTSIEGTYPHRFYSAAKDEWIQMGEFKAGDPIRTVDGIDTIVKSIESKPENTKVYTLQTAEYHNFFIVTNNDDKYIVKAVIPGNWDKDDDYLLQRYPVLPINGGAGSITPGVE